MYGVILYSCLLVYKKHYFSLNRLVVEKKQSRFNQAREKWDTMSVSTYNSGNSMTKLSWTKKAAAKAPASFEAAPSPKREVAEPASCLEGVYSFDYDLSKADATICNYLQWNTMYKPKICQEQIQELSAKKPQTINDAKTIDNIKKKLREESNKWTSKNWIEEYKSVCGPLVEEYKQNYTKKNSLVWGKKKKEETIDYSERRLWLIHRFLQLAENYIRVDVVRQITADDSCPKCGHDLSNIYQCKDTGLVSCPDCGCERRCMLRNHSSGDTTISSKSSYEDKKFLQGTATVSR